MSEYYVVPDTSGYGNWAIKKKGRKVQDAQTQQTAVNQLRRNGDPGTEGDQVTVYGSRQNQIVNNFTLS